MKKLTVYLCLASFLALVGFNSCKKTILFPSKAGLKKKLNGSWERIEIGNVGSIQKWTFNDEQVVINTIVGVPYPDSSTYVLQAGLSKAYITFEDFGQFWLNERFQIMQLNKDILVIYYNSGVNGPYTAEFKKIE
ncbi:MAG: hypothetical protein KDD36_07995 [Flavobacteriales bacterium]|nr:hypothetical protein [Flavobacteriales bacterium]